MSAIKIALPSLLLVFALCVQPMIAEEPQLQNQAKSEHTTIPVSQQLNDNELNSIRNSLLNGKRLVVHPDSSGNTIIEEIGLQERYEEWANPKKARSNDEALSNKLIEIMTQNPNATLIVPGVENYVKQMRQQYKDADMKALANSLDNLALAVRVGIPQSVQVFEEYPDFAKFMRANFLFKHLPYHQHTLTIGEDGMPMLLYDGQMTPWTVLKELVKLDSSGKMTDHYYTKDGIVAGQPHSDLRPFKQVDSATYGQRYILEVVNYQEKFPAHVWLRIINPAGELYSVGFQPKDPIRNAWSAVSNISTSEGRLYSPDPYEIPTADQKQTATPIEITAEQYEKIMAFLRQYQQDPDKCYQISNMFGGTNCAGFVQNAMDEIGLDVSATGSRLPFANPYDILVWQNRAAGIRKKAIAQATAEGLSPQGIEDLKYWLPEKGANARLVTKECADDEYICGMWDGLLEAALMAE